MVEGTEVALKRPEIAVVAASTTTQDLPVGQSVFPYVLPLILIVILITNSHLLCGNEMKNTHHSTPATFTLHPKWPRKRTPPAPILR